MWLIKIDLKHYRWQYLPVYLLRRQTLDLYDVQRCCPFGPGTKKRAWTKCRQVSNYLIINRFFSKSALHSFFYSGAFWLFVRWPDQY